MKIQSLSGRAYVVFSPETLSAECECPLAILHGDLTMYQLLTENNLLPMKHCFAVMILSTNRLDDFSPWPASALHEKFPDFKGNANMYLKWIQQELLPKIRDTYPITISPDHVGMLGQSLGGLLNMYAYLSPYSDFWSHAACVSPSSWYPSFIDKLQTELSPDFRKIWYISSGTQEGQGHNDIKKDTVSLTRKILHLFDENKHEVDQYWDNGRHHELLVDRYERALSWLDKRLL